MAKTWVKTGRKCSFCRSDIWGQVGEFFGHPPEMCSHQRVDVQFMKYGVSDDEWRDFLIERALEDNPM